MTKKMTFLALLGLLFVWTGLAWGATDTKTLTINATVADRATLTLSTYTINFPDADPDVTPSIGATENPVTVTAKVRTGKTSTATLTVLANGDLTNASSDTIDISNVTWTAGGSGFVGGTMNKGTAQSAGSWTGSGSRSSSFNYFLANSWDYFTGNYTATATYTLTAP